MPASKLDLLIEAVKAAGDVALRVAEGRFEIYHKHDGSSVTDGDLAVDKVLHVHLMGAHPDYGWFSEEGKDPEARHRNERCWIVDPIDGTSDYIRKGSNWCIGAALLDGGVVMASALYQPKTEVLFFAARGKGSFRNGERMQMRPSEKSLSVMCSKSDAMRLPGVSRVSRQDQPFLMRLARLAGGELDAVVASTPKSDWDLAPATLLVEEADGIATSFRGKALRFNTQTGKQEGVIAALPGAHQAIRKMLEAP